MKHVLQHYLYTYVHNCIIHMVHMSSMPSKIVPLEKGKVEGEDSKGKRCKYCMYIK